ncbi:MAG: hypothetical protein ABI947_14740 [Chloroflexota bacterium]
MLSEQLLNELHNLNRTEKLRIVQILVNELAVEETSPEMLRQLAVQYEVWSPYDAFGAAHTLQTMLDEYKRDHDQS